MPYKEACLQYVDGLDQSARAIQSVNTIVNTDSDLQAYNTDYVAIRSLVAEAGVAPADTFAVHGSGGMAKAVLAALADSGLRAGTVIHATSAAAASLRSGTAMSGNRRPVTARQSC